MPIEVTTGRAGAGKSTRLAERLFYVLKRNYKYWEKTGIVRLVYTNINLHPEVEQAYKRFIVHWKDQAQLPDIVDSDVFIDEIANYFDSANWQQTSLSVKRWIQQHRKLGVEIYGNAQDFGQVDIAFRRLTDKLYYLVKLISNQDPSPTRPPIKRVWGLVVVYTLNPTDYKEDQKENKASFHSLMVIRRWKTELFNTRQPIEKGIYPPLQHVERICELHGKADGCDYTKIIHV